MEKEILNEILQNFAKGKASETEHQQFNTYLETLSGEDYEELLEQYRTMLNGRINYAPANEELLQHILVRIKTYDSTKSSNSHWLRYAAAAILLLLFSVTALYYYRLNEKSAEHHFVRETANIKNHADKAVLTLANGQKINLNDAGNGKIAEQAGIRISKTKEGQLVYYLTEGKNLDKPGIAVQNTISTPKGGRYQLNLPDGTEIWLNSASSLSFPARFTGKERKVTLSGEAYFKVAKNAALPFRVVTPAQVVEVLGTAFNINAYRDEPFTRTTLLEGSVKLEAMDNKPEKASPKILSPGEQALLTDGKIQIKNIDAQEAISWVNGYFIFQDEGIKSIMRKVERYYDVEVVYASQVNEEPIGGQISKSSTLAALLNALESTGEFRFKVEGRRITVMP